jgi:hypothetical protein
MATWDGERTKQLPSAEAADNSSGRDRLTATWVELTIRLGVLALLVYWSFVLVQPFITIAIWSAVVTVALYPVYEKLAAVLGGRRRLAAAGADGLQPSRCPWAGDVACFGLD